MNKTAELTVEAIDAMLAGPGMDALVAEHVFSMVRNGGDCWSPHDAKSGVTLDVCLSLAPYSTNIAAAWEVVEHIRTKYQFTLISQGRTDNRSHLSPQWRAIIQPYSGKWDGGVGTTPMLAICRAALKDTLPR